MKYSANKDINCLVRNLIRQGWTFYRGTKHGRLRHPQGIVVLTVPNTPSDWRAFIKFNGDVRRCWQCEKSL